MAIPTLTSEGYLPPGRYRATLEEVHDSFVAPYPHASVRHAIWDEWQTATELLVTTVGAAAAWISGSFISPKPEPGDIDCVYVVPQAAVDALSSGSLERKVLQLFSGGHTLQDQLKLRVDSYVLPWIVSSVLNPNTPGDVDYCRSRGYWDDFWQRLRSGTKTDAPKAEDALPRRGYVEVILDDYSV